MNTRTLETCAPFMESQFRYPSTQQLKSRMDIGRPAITISRQTGARGRSIGNLLIDYLRKNDGDTEIPWTLFDRDLVEKVLEDHALPQRLAEFMPEDRTKEIEGVVGEILGLHPSLWTLFQQTTETVLKLARMGHVILVGRGSNIITAHLRNVVHVRFIGSLAYRVKQVKKYDNLDEAEAEKRIKKEDSARKRYLKQHFNEDIDDPSLYDITLNTDRVPEELAARWIGDFILSHTN